MTSKKKQPKCMDINNYFKIEKLFKKDFKVCDYYEVCNSSESESDSEKVYFTGSMKKCNKFIEDTFKTNKFLYCKLDLVKPCFPIYKNFENTTEPYEKYCRDFEKYVKLFLFRRIGVMSIVNLIINGNYFNEYYCLREILFEIDEYMIWEYDTFEEYINNRNNDYKLINGMCNNFKTLQYIE